MAFDPTFPPDNIDVDKSIFRANNQEIAKIASLFRSWSGKAGEILAVLDTEIGPDVVSAISAAEALSFAGRMLGFFIPEPVEITSSTSLSLNNHAGRLLYCVNSTAITLTVNKNADPASGATHGFACTVLNGASGTVTVTSTNLTRTGTTNTKVSVGQAANIWVDANRNLFFFTGGTEA